MSRVDDSQSDGPGFETHAKLTLTISWMYLVGQPHKQLGAKVITLS